MGVGLKKIEEKEGGEVRGRLGWWWYFENYKKILNNFNVLVNSLSLLLITVILTIILTFGEISQINML